MKTQSAAFSLSTALSDADDVVDSESLTPNILKILFFLNLHTNSSFFTSFVMEYIVLMLITDSI